MGRHESYEAADFDLIDDGDFLSEKLKSAAPIDVNSLEHKQGPVEIGRSHYKTAKFDLPPEQEFLAERGISKVEYSNRLGENKRVSEIGVNKDFDAASYEYSDGYSIDQHRGLKK